MRKRFRIISALLLSLIMLLSLLPMYAAAEDEMPESETEPSELPPDGETEPSELPAESETEPSELPANGNAEPTAESEHHVCEDELIVGTNSVYVGKGETVYWRFVPEEELTYEFVITGSGQECELTDSAFLILDGAAVEGDMSRDQIRFVLHAGETYYVGVRHKNKNQGGSIYVFVHTYPANACGNDMTWKFFPGDGILSLGGSYIMWDFKRGKTPWAANKDRIKTLRMYKGGTSGWRGIGSYAFYDCSNLSTIENMALMDDIGAYAFYGTAIEAISCRGTVGAHAFENCKNLKKAFLKENVRSVGQYAFANCGNLTTLTMEENVAWIGAHAFENTGIKEIALPDKILAISAYTFAGCRNLTTVKLPESTEKIRENAFLNCGITSLHIPAKVDTIDRTAFLGCTSLAAKAFTVDPENETFSAENGLLLSKNGEELLFAVQSLSACTVPSHVCTVKTGAFEGSPTLKKLTLQPGVRTVEAGAVKNCAALRSVTIAASVSTVGSGAFSGCTALRDVYYNGTEAERNRKLSVDPSGNDALLNAEWHYQEPCNFDGTVEWNANDVQMKSGTPYVVWNGSAFTPRFTLIRANGETVDPATYSVAYQENVNAGTGYVFVTFSEGYTGTLRLYFKIYLPATTETYVENVKNGVRILWKPVEGAAGYVIYRRAWNLTDAGWTTFERWNNTTGTTWTDTSVYAGTRYQYGVKAYFDRRTDAVTGTEIGGNVGDNFNLGIVGPLKTTVRITTRTLKSLTAGDKKITATWDTSKVFTGYQLKFALNEAFTQNVQSVKVADAKAASTVLSSLTNGKPYYVCVRSYHIFEGMNYYGQWSNVIRVKPGSGETVYDVMYRALLIGESNYAGNKALKGPVNDMNAMSGMLRGLNRPFSVKTLPNSKRKAILDAIRSTYADAMDNDVSLFYYSGHGVNAGGDDTYQGTLVPVDENYITMKELAAELSKVRGRVVVILDSCMSGAAIESNSAQSEADAFLESAEEAFSGYWLEEDTDVVPGMRMGEFRKSKFIVITAASAYASSYEGKFDGSGTAQGAFTAALIKGMGCKYPKGAYSGSMPADSDGNKQVTLYEIFCYARDQASNWAGQTARYYGPNDEILFRRK